MMSSKGIDRDRGDSKSEGKEELRIKDYGVNKVFDQYGKDKMCSYFCRLLDGEVYNARRVKREREQ